MVNKKKLKKKPLLRLRNSFKNMTIFRTRTQNDMSEEVKEQENTKFANSYNHYISIGL